MDVVIVVCTSFCFTSSLPQDTVALNFWPWPQIHWPLTLEFG